jgi:hypothetical protein
VVEGGVHASPLITPGRETQRLRPGNLRAPRRRKIGPD